MTKIKPTIHTIFFDNSSQIKVKYRTLDGKLCGLYQRFDYNGKRTQTKSFLNNRLHGIQKNWYHSGQKAYEINYINGIPDGTERYWGKSGQLQVEYIYSNGKRHGIQRLWDKKGKLTLESLVKNGNECWRRCWDKEGNLTVNGAPKLEQVPIPPEIRLVSEFLDNIKTLKKPSHKEHIKDPLPQ